MSREARNDLLVDALRLHGVEISSEDTHRRVLEESHVLADEVVPRMTSRCQQILGQIGDAPWKSLLSKLTPDEQRGVMKLLRLPAESWRKPTAQQQTHFATKLRTGLDAWKDPVVQAAHDLTQPVRAALVASARAGAQWQGDDTTTAAVRAAAVALCPQPKSMFLPVVLTWMREHDTTTFDLLLPDDDMRAALQRFWEGVTAEPHTDTEPNDGDESSTPAQLAEAAHRAVERAVVVCRDALAGLEQGLVPDESTLIELTNARDVVLRVSDVLADRLSYPVKPSLEAIDTAVQRIARSSDEVITIRRLMHAEVPDSAGEALSAVVDMANCLLDRWPPTTKEDLADADLLTAVTDLAVDASAAEVDDSEIETRYERLRETAPKEIVPLLTAAVRGRVRVPTTDADTAVPIEPVTPTPADQEEVTSAANNPAPVEVAPEPRPAEEEAAEPPRTSAEANTVPSTPAAEKPTAPHSVDSESASTVISPRDTASAEPTSRTDVLDRAIVAKAAVWLDHEQFALAHHLLQPHEPALAEAAMLAAVAAVVTGPNCTHEPELDALARNAKAHLLTDGDAARLLTIGALIKASVTTGNPALGSLLVELSGHMDPTSAAFTRVVGEAIRRGVLAGRGVTVLVNAGPDDVEISTAAARARERVDAHRTVRLPRASAVLARLRAATGSESEEAPETLGDALHAAAADRRAHVLNVKAISDKLTKTSALERLIDDDDKAHRPPASKPISGAVRQEMLTTLREDIAAMDGWIRAVERHARSTTFTYDDVQLSELRTTLLDSHKAVLNLLATRESDQEPLVAAAARAAHTSLVRLIDMIKGTPIHTDESAASPVLDFPLLALPGTTWDAATGLVISLPRSPQDLTTELLKLPDTGIDPASIALEKAGTDDFESAKFVVTDLPEPRRAEVIAQLTDLRAARVTQLRDHLKDVRRQLVRAGVNGPNDETAAATISVALGAVTENQLVDVVDQALSTLKEAHGDLRVVSGALTRVEQRIDELRHADAQRLNEWLDNLADGCAEDDIQRIRGHIARGHLDLAEDDLEHLAAGDQLFQRDEDGDFDGFYPAGVDALAGGIDHRLLSALQDGRPHLALPVAPIPEPFRGDVWAGLNGWVELRKAFTTGWNQSFAFDNLLPALRLIGLDVRTTNVDFLDGKRPFTVWARGRRYLEVEVSSTTGKPLVPALGSAARGRYRLLIVWNEPTVEQLDEWREADNSVTPLIVCYLGTLSTENRMRLARLWWEPSRRAAVILDDALLTWVATRRGNYDMFVRLSLPFTATQPFIAEKRPDVPAEMFYGREEEKRRLMQPANAPSIIYGGRGMGKSALMHKIESEADNTDFVVVWFEVDRVPGIDEDPYLLWGDLAQRLSDKGVGKSLGSGRQNPRDSVPRTVQRWLQEKSSRRLLLLLDEAEGFVEGDAPTFAHVRRLQALKTNTDSRCQVVFAGLHSVQHYSVGNSPLSPTGHMQIGPLDSQPAYDLVTRPIFALGYRLDDDDVQRIVLHCNYQPYLIQLVAEKLLSRQFTARGAARTSLAAPPWRIPTSEVVDVLSDAETRRDLRAALGLTLDLDKRTRVITNVLALHSYQNGQGARVSDVDLYTKCREAWPHGFEDTGFDAFRQLLDELAGLGILAEANDDHSGRAIRNETVLRALGSREEISHNLHMVSQIALPVRQVREYHRPIRDDGVGRSPLVNAQLAQLFRKGNTARVIVGSEATGIDQVAATLQELKPQLVDVDTVDMKTLGEFKTKLETGATDAHRLLVVGDLRANTGAEASQQAFEYALGDQAGVGIPHNRAASRTAALIAGVENVKWLLRLAASADSDKHVMPLQRYDEYTLPLRWQGDPALKLFTEEEFGNQALELTGGWPFLVEQLAAEVTSSRSKTPQSLGSLLGQLRGAWSNSKWCERFLIRSGADFVGWPEMRPLAQSLMEYDGACSLTDLSELAGRDVAEVKIFGRVARWLGIVSVVNNGELMLAPLIAQCMHYSQS